MSILDGFDLGIGVLFPFARNEMQRDQMMRSVAPFWDGNETWLVLGGGGLLVAFPDRLRHHHAGDVSAGDRACCWRWCSARRRVRIPPRRRMRKPWWNFAFTFGSVLAAFSQGIILGGLIQGIKVRERTVCRRSLRLGNAVRVAVRCRRWWPVMRCSARPG